MRQNVFCGSLAYWSLAQCAVAAAKISEFEPTWEGLESLQCAWYQRYSAAPDRAETVRNLSWARKALKDIADRQPKYERVPA